MGAKWVVSSIEEANESRHRLPIKYSFLHIVTGPDSGTAYIYV